MEAVGEIGWILIFLLFLISVWHPIGLGAVTVWRTSHFEEQRRVSNSVWLVRIPPAYVLETGWFFSVGIATVGWFFWIHAKADIDPWYDVANALFAFLHILIKVYYYLAYTTQYTTGEAATITAAFITGMTVWSIAGATASWKFFWFFSVLPPWLLYVCVFTYGIAFYPIPPLPTKSPAVSPPEELRAL